MKQIPRDDDEILFTKLNMGLGGRLRGKLSVRLFNGMYDRMCSLVDKRARRVAGQLRNQVGRLR